VSHESSLPYPSTEEHRRAVNLQGVRDPKEVFGSIGIHALPPPAGYPVQPSTPSGARPSKCIIIVILIVESRAVGVCAGFQTGDRLGVAECTLKRRTPRESCLAMALRVLGTLQWPAIRVADFE
jgi:hypothetical protein